MAPLGPARPTMSRAPVPPLAGAAPPSPVPARRLAPIRRSAPARRPALPSSVWARPSHGVLTAARCPRPAPALRPSRPVLAWPGALVQPCPSAAHPHPTLPLPQRGRGTPARLAVPVRGAARRAPARRDFTTSAMFPCPCTCTRAARGSARRGRGDPARRPHPIPAARSLELGRRASGARPELGWRGRGDPTRPLTRPWRGPPSASRRALWPRPARGARPVRGLGTDALARHA
jgi:hypothetical protein